MLSHKSNSLKYNFNLPKRAPAPYGYSGDMESWEFQNNTSNLMLFKSDFFDESIYTDPTTGDTKERWRFDYEARFPSDEWINYAKLQELQSFIYSTYRAGATGNTLANPVTYPSTKTEIVEVVDPETGAISYEEKTYKVDVTYTTDTADYRLAKFRAEFGNYAEVDSFIFYYIFTELFLMVDSRAKNLFIGFSGSDTTGLKAIDRKAVAEPYDMDTAIGTNNEGALVFGYSYEDTDHLEGGAEIFNGQTSVLWCNIRDAFPSEITAMYQRLRSGGLNYANVEKRFEDHQGKWSEAIFNEDSWFKYIYPLIKPDTGKDPTGSYLSMMQGSKAEQRKWWLYNRFRYMDSKWNAGDALTDVIQVRGYAKADITVTPYADIYPTVKYGSYIVSQRGTHGVPVTLACPVDNLNDTEIYIYSAPQLSSVGDLSPLKVGFADFSKATSLQSIVVGSGASGYTNLNLKELRIGTNNFLKLVDARNCSALIGSVDLSGTRNIEEVYFDGTNISAVDLPVGGVLKTISLPSTITNLTIRNQNEITHFSVTNNDYSNISTLRVENSSSAIPILDILSSVDSGSRVRIIGFTMAVSTQKDVEDFYAYLDTMRGLGDNGETINNPVVSGTITGLDTITGTWLAQMNARYPNIKIEYQHISSILKYYTYDGGTLLYTETVKDGGNGTYNGTPSRTATAQYTFTFVGWSLEQDAQTADSNATKNVSADRNIYAAYSRTLRSYTVYWRNADNTLLETDTNVNYGSMPQYNGATPTYQGRTSIGWSPSVSSVVGDVTYTATYVPTYQVNFYNDNGTTLLQTVTVEEGSTAVYTGATPTSSEDASLEWLGWATSKNGHKADAVLTNIQSNMTVYAAFDEQETITDSWATILANESPSTSYSIGDTKMLDLGTEGKHLMEIVAFDEDDKADGTGKAKITWISKDLLNTTHVMNATQKTVDGETAYTAGGWLHSDMREYLKNTIKPLIPAEVRNGIVEVTKVQSIYTNGAKVINGQTTVDDVWIPSNHEVGLGTSYETTGAVYSSKFTDANSRIKKRSGSAGRWWLRSANNASSFGNVNSSGRDGNYYAVSTYGVALGFCTN